jgi:hypothetical protein
MKNFLFLVILTILMFQLVFCACLKKQDSKDELPTLEIGLEDVEKKMESLEDFSNCYFFFFLV